MAYVQILIAGFLWVLPSQAVGNGGSSIALEPAMEHELSMEQAAMDALDQKLSNYEHAKEEVEAMDAASDRNKKSKYQRAKKKVSALLEAAAKAKHRAPPPKPPSKSSQSIEELKAALAGPLNKGPTHSDKELPASEQLLRNEEMEADLKSAKAVTDDDDGVEDVVDHSEGQGGQKRGHLRASSKPANAAPLVDPKPDSKATPAQVKPKETLSGAAAASSMEKELTDLMMAGGSLVGTPFGKSVKQIRDLIEKDMMPKVLAAHEENQKTLNKLVKELRECGSTKITQIAQADKKKQIYLKTSPLHKTCREGEAGKHTEKIDCRNEEKDKKRIMKLKCKEFAMVAKRYGDEQANGQIVKRGGSEGTESYVRRMTNTICGKYPPGGKGGGGKDGFLDLYMIAKEGCEKATKRYNAQVKKCDIIEKEYLGKKSECDNLQDQMDAAACKRAVEMKDACETYSECYFDKRKVHDSTEEMVKTEEKDRKAEWRGLKRMQCLMDAFGDGKVKSDEIETCRKQVHALDHLNIRYAKLPTLVSCNVPLRYPSSPEYKLAEFAMLPALAKGKEDANACTGVIPIRTEPNEGSPTSCKCERVTLNGPYSAGPLVKCSNCTDVRRSQDRNSCPEGTKLFSPRSQSDWKTILASVGEVRDPYWIVDVTRPQNGCGFCGKKPMNSQRNAQGTQWKTSDNSPWWLRSTEYKFSSATATYHSNCYLGLLKPYDSEMTLNFAAHACKFHSKSYYCQLREQSIKPKRGSPVSCKCENVVLTGPYSAGGLLKCTGCLAVARSTQKNSCPMGTKIFSPANAKDWKTFLASAQPLRSPNWIVDVTRPQNGCGGCTKHAMNSKNPAQMTWRTSDGSAWWLRSSKYTEPSKDYFANCYMDLFKPPPSENSVMFKTKKCRYFSNSYYCQPVKSKVPKLPPAPPPAPPPIRRPMAVRTGSKRKKSRREQMMEKLRKLKARRAKSR